MNSESEPDTYQIHAEKRLAKEKGKKVVNASELDSKYDKFFGRVLEYVLEEDSDINLSDVSQKNSDLVKKINTEYKEQFNNAVLEISTIGHNEDLSPKTLQTLILFEKDPLIQKSVLD